MRRVVEPGAIDLWVGRSCAERVAEARVMLVGGVHEVELADARWSQARSPAGRHRTHKVQNDKPVRQRLAFAI